MLEGFIRVYMLYKEVNNEGVCVQGVGEEGRRELWGPDAFLVNPPLLSNLS